MKKFISALSSLVIAATALGGTLAFSTDAATNGSVDSTIIEFRSNGKNEITAKAGDKVPVSMYIPQSSGFYSLALKLAINGAKTLGQGSITDLDGNVINNYKYAFGNYGIQITDVEWPEFCCLDSGYTSDSDMFAGYYNTSKFTFFTTDAYNIQYTASHAVQKNTNIDASTPWELAGKPEEYDNYTPVYTWTKDEDWAYTHSFTDFSLSLPADLPDGVYTLDLYYDQYYNVAPAALFDEKTKEELPDEEKTPGKTAVNGVKGAQKVTSVPLKITVGNPGPVETEPVTTTTAPPAQTTKPEVGTTTTVKDVPISGSTIVYDLIPKGKDYTAAPAGAAGQNVYKATAGEELTVDWTVKNDGGTAGLQMYFDFSEVEYVKGKIGKAYMVTPQYNDAYANTSKTENPTDGGQVIYTFGGTEEMTAKDGAVIYSFTVKVPEKEGTYSIKEDTRNPNKVIPLDQSKPYDYIVHGLDIVVGDPIETQPVVTTTKGGGTTPGTTTTKAEVVSGDAIVYDLIPKGKDYTAAPANAKGQNVYNVPAGDEGTELTIDWTVKNDGGTAGIQMYFDFSEIEYVKGKIGKAYMVTPQYNDQYANTSKTENPTDGGQVIYTFGGTEEMTAKDGAVIYSFTVKIPTEKGTYSITEDTRNPNKVIPLDQSKPYNYVVHGLDIVVGAVAAETTTAPVVTTTAPITTTTAPVTTVTEPVVTTSTAPVVTTTTPVATEPGVTTTVTVGEVLYGDVNCDGEVKINDVVLLNRYLAKTADISAQGKKNADCVNDGKITSDDSTAIKEFLARLIKKLPKA